jgi:hypothetical protein
MIPEKMSVVEVYLLYSHIILLQDTPDAFHFTVIDQTADDEIILSLSSPGSLTDEDSNISTPSTGAVVLYGVSDINDGSSGAIPKPGTKSTKKRPSKDNEIPDGVPAKKQRKLK